MPQSFIPFPQIAQLISQPQRQHTIACSAFTPLYQHLLLFVSCVSLPPSQFATFTWCAILAFHFVSFFFPIALFAICNTSAQLHFFQRKNANTNWKYKFKSTWKSAQNDRTRRVTSMLCAAIHAMDAKLLLTDAALASSTAAAVSWSFFGHSYCAAVVVAINAMNFVARWTHQQINYEW